MLFKVGDQIIDTEITPVGLIFKTKEEANTVANIIANIKNGGSEYSTENNGNWWMMFPSGTSKEDIDKWSTLTYEQKQMLNGKSEVTNSLEYEL